MPEVEVRRHPCEDCKATGRCPTCDGARRLTDGSECLECVEGECLLCLGTGTARDFYIGGRLYTGRSWHFRWRDWLEIGLVMVAMGVIAAWSEAEPGFASVRTVVLAAVLAGGGVMTGQAIRQLSHDRAVDRAMDREFPRP